MPLQRIVVYFRIDLTLPPNKFLDNFTGKPRQCGNAKRLVRHRATFVMCSLPLDRARRLRRDVINHTVDALDLVDDAGRGLAQEFHVGGIARSTG
jgi:hypothetical protein